jgi:acyl-coenzyme A thioesterase PaaI-like protein
MPQAALEALLDEHAPRWRTFSRITALSHRAITIGLLAHDDQLRGGGTLSGPTLMALADRAAYYLTLAVVAPLPDAVTASLHIHFLVRPQPDDVRATATLLLAGTRLAISVVEIHAGDERVAHATVTYALPVTS